MVLAVINADLPVTFGGAPAPPRAPPPAPLGDPAPLTRWLMLKTPSPKGDDGKEVQQALVDNEATITVDGDFGPMTSDAVSDYEGAHGLEVDGVVGPQTAKALGLRGV